MIRTSGFTPCMRSAHGGRTSKERMCSGLKKTHRDSNLPCERSNGFGEISDSVPAQPDVLFITGRFSGRHAVWRSLPTERRTAGYGPSCPRSISRICMRRKAKHACDTF